MSLRLPGGMPSLADGSSCSKVEAAHGIVFRLDLKLPEHRQMLEGISDTAAAGLPVRVVVRPGQDHQFGDLLEGVPVWAGTAAPEEWDEFLAQIRAGHLHDIGLT